MESVTWGLVNILAVAIGAIAIVALWCFSKHFFGDDQGFPHSRGK